jgi:hypothetical protein
VLIDWLKTSKSNRKTKLTNDQNWKSNPSIVAAKILYTIYEDSNDWPLDILTAFIDDSLGLQMWVDHRETKSFVDNLLYWTNESINPIIDIKSYENSNMDVSIDDDDEGVEEILDSSSTDMIPSAAILTTPLNSDLSIKLNVSNRFQKYSTHELITIVINLLSDTSGSSSSTSSNNVLNVNSQNLILTICKFIAVDEMKVYVLSLLPKWFHNPALSDTCIKLIHSIMNSLHPLSIDTNNYIEINSSIKINKIFASYRYLPSNNTNDVNIQFITIIIHLISKLKLSQYDSYKNILLILIMKSYDILIYVMKLLILNDINEKIYEMKYNSSSMSTNAGIENINMKLCIFLLSSLSKSATSIFTVSQLQPTHHVASMVLGQVIRSIIVDIWKKFYHQRQNSKALMNKLQNQQSSPTSPTFKHSECDSDTEYTFKYLLEIVILTVKSLNIQELSLDLLLQQVFVTLDNEYAASDVFLSSSVDLSCNFDNMSMVTTSQNGCQNTPLVGMYTINKYSTWMLLFYANLSSILQLLLYFEISKAEKEYEREQEKLTRLQSSTYHPDKSNDIVSSVLSSASSGGAGRGVGGRLGPRGPITSSSGRVLSRGSADLSISRHKKPEMRQSSIPGSGNNSSASSISKPQELDAKSKIEAAKALVEGKSKYEKELRHRNSIIISKITEISLKWYLNEYLRKLYYFIIESTRDCADNNMSNKGVRPKGKHVKKVFISKVPFLVDILHIILCYNTNTIFTTSYSTIGHNIKNIVTDIDKYVNVYMKDNMILNDIILQLLCNVLITINYICGIDILLYNYNYFFAYNIKFNDIKQLNKLNDRNSSHIQICSDETNQSANMSYSFSTTYANNMQLYCDTTHNNMDQEDNSINDVNRSNSLLVYNGEAFMLSGIEFIQQCIQRSLRGKGVLESGRSYSTLNFNVVDIKV